MKADGYGRGSIDREVTICVQANAVNTILRDVFDVNAERKTIFTDFFAITDDDISCGGRSPTPRIQTRGVGSMGWWGGGNTAVS